MTGLNDPKSRLIFALDVPGVDEAVSFVQKLDGSVGMFKVGLELFIKEGPAVLTAIRKHSDAEIFLDLKLHDIPATLNRALKSASKHHARFITIHFEEGELVRSIPKEIKNSKLDVLAVTVLTSISKEDLDRFSLYRAFKKHLFKQKELYSVISRFPPFSRRSPKFLQHIVIERAMQAKMAGCSGVICSGKEVELIKTVCGSDFITVVPGIRPADSVVSNDDQSRVTTPTQAIQSGADYLVVGRPIRDAADPKAAAQHIVQEISEALSGAK
jgi:orotidine-5'-phosphate decarboxylase